MVKSYWVRLLVFSVVGGLIALGISMLIPKKFEGIVQILIDQKTVSPNMPTSAVDQTVTDLLDFARSRSITTQVQALTSIEVLGRAAQTTYVELGLQGQPSGEFEYFELTQNIAIEAEVGSDLVTLRVRMSDPLQAQALARNIFLAFEDFNNTTTRTLAGQAINSLESQMGEVEGRLNALDETTRKLRVELGTPNIDSQIQSDIGTVGRITDTRDATAIDLAAIEGRLRVLKRTIVGVPKTISAAKSDAYNPNLYSFDQQLATLRTELAGMEERFLPNHESIVAQKERIRKLEGERAAQNARVNANETTGPNPFYQNLESQIAEAEAARTGYQQRLAEANTVIQSAQALLATRPEAQAKLIDLARQQATLERTYASYADRLQSLELAGKGRTAPIRMAGAGGNPEAVSPKPVINTLVGLVLGFVLGVMSMLRTESTRQPVRSIMQLNLLARDPVFRAVPNMALPFRGVDKSPPEAFEALVANALRSEKRPYRVGVVSVMRDSGGSTTAANLAVSASRRGLETVLVSLDPRSPNIKRFGAGPSGQHRVNELLSTVVMGGADIVHGVQGRTSMSGAVVELEREVTVFDFEPASDAADYAFASALLDEIIVLVRANRVNSVDFLAVQQAVTDSGCPVVTVVLSRGSEGDAVADAADPTELRALPS